MSVLRDMPRRGGHPAIGKRHLQPGEPNPVGKPPLSQALKRKLQDHPEQRARILDVQARKT
jgi:hypothetical protein